MPPPLLVVSDSHASSVDAGFHGTNSLRAAMVGGLGTQLRMVSRVVLKAGDSLTFICYQEQRRSSSAAP